MRTKLLHNRHIDQPILLRNIMTKILTQAQAEAVYSAMCALNNVGALLDTYGNGWRVMQRHDETVRVEDLNGRTIEKYTSQASFASFYDLQQG